jgi:phospholipid/cholesterol/gamma-HCH transport system substrate-binding protein
MNVKSQIQSHFWTNLRVGLLFLIVVVIIMIALFQVKSKTDLLEAHSEYKINFPYVNGLKLGAGVHLAGVRIGEVTGISFPTDLQNTSVTITIKLKDTAAGRIRKNSAVYIDSPSLLSEKSIQITFGTADSPAVKEGDTLNGLPEKP